MRKKIYEIIEKNESGKLFSASAIYDYIIILAVIINLIPMAMKTEPLFFFVTNKITAMIFIIDYILREVTADYKLDRPGWRAFVRYPFTPMAIIDLISILPSFISLQNVHFILRLLKLLRVIRVVRVLKILRYSKNFEILSDVLKRSKSELLTVAVLAVGYILASALVVFNVEPDTYDTFFDAIYWATISLTTVGYGDIYPVTDVGRLVTMISSFFGIAVVALPAGIITGQFMMELSGGRGKNANGKEEESDMDTRDRMRNDW